MYNSELPNRAQLPTSGQLLRSTFIALATAAAILVTIVLPAEYGIDPTGAGRVLGLKNMGEIKVQLQEEAERDGARDTRNTAPRNAEPEQRSGLMDRVFAFVFTPAHAEEKAAVRTDETSVTLEPDQGAEVKADLKQGQTITYSWTANGGKVNHDTHGEPYSNPNATTSYSKGRGVAGDQGTLEAAFDGKHGWFWRNRSSAPVTVTLKTSGDYKEIKRVQ
jgi:hypothetical protein